MAQSQRKKDRDEIEGIISAVPDQVKGFVFFLISLIIVTLFFTIIQGDYESFSRALAQTFTKIMGTVFVISLVGGATAYFFFGKVDTNQLYFATLAVECYGAFYRTYKTALSLLIVGFIIFFVEYSWFWNDATYHNGDPIWELEQQGVALKYGFYNGLSFVLVASLLVGFAPILWSMMTRLPFSLWSTGDSAIDKVGGRELVTSESEKLTNVKARIANSGKGNAPAPKQWVVIDSPIPNSFTIGKVVYLTRALFDSPWLGASVAHELGHIKNYDGVLFLALRRLFIPFATLLKIDREPSPAGIITGGDMNRGVSVNKDSELYYALQMEQTKKEMAIQQGGLGLLWFAEAWAQVWRKKDFDADFYAVQLGYGNELLEFLKQYEQTDQSQPFMLRGRPSTTLRIAEIQRVMKVHADMRVMEEERAKKATSATIAEPVKERTPYKRKFPEGERTHSDLYSNTPEDKNDAEQKQ